MAWIESHTDLEDHPKRKRVSSLMGWDKHTTIGRLHCFWWWCLRYAEDGDLRKFNDIELGESVGLNGDDCKKFVDIMVQAGFLEREPFFRIHDWIGRVKGYLVSKYHTSNPKKLKSIVGKYRKSTGCRVGQPKGDPVGMPKGDPPNLTLPNQPYQPKEEKHVAKFTPPTLEEVKEYIGSKGYSVDPERWFAFYQSNGWRVGKNPMKDWKAAVVTWTRNGFENKGGKNGTGNSFRANGSSAGQVESADAVVL